MRAEARNVRATAAAVAAGDFVLEKLRRSILYARLWDFGIS